jgi:hypothetical protein
MGGKPTADNQSAERDIRHLALLRKSTFPLRPKIFALQNQFVASGGLRDTHALRLIAHISPTC